MIEDKTEDKIDDKAGEAPQTQPEAPQHPQSGRERLRSLWARIQCAGVLRRHHLSKDTSHRVERFTDRIGENPVAYRIGEGLYSLGFSGEYVLVRAGRGIKGAAHWTAEAVSDAARNVSENAFPEVKQMAHELFGPIYIFFRGLRNVFVHQHQVRQEEGSAEARRASAQHLSEGVRKYAGMLPRMAAYILPLIMLAVMVTVVRQTISRQYTLAVQVEGVTVGYVENENVFDAARDAVLERINYAEDHEWTINPTYTLSVSDEVMDENEMADAIIRTSTDEITTATALYLDGELTAVCADGNALSSYLNSLIEPFADPDDPNVSVSFNRDVELETGLYFTDSVQDYDSVVSLLAGVRQEEKIYTVVVGDTISGIASRNNLTMSELCALNTDFGENGLEESSLILPGDELIVTKEEAMLEVRVTKVVTWEEEIPYTTERSSSSDYAFGTVQTVQEGENGLRSITAREVYDADGVLLEQTILSSEVVREAVPEQIVTGTKLPSGSVAQVGNGTFIWPVPQYSYCSRWYTSGHKGVDICAPAGTPIYASASGVVSKAGYNSAGAGSGYGYSVIINHGNGYSTVYAHCISLTVSAGQAVSQGQLIGYVGSTGRSSGNHCHFEIRYNGRYLPPQNYFKK